MTIETRIAAMKEGDITIFNAFERPVVQKVIKRLKKRYIRKYKSKTFTKNHERLTELTLVIKVT